MGLVGGSRHYAGGGLGQEGAWYCPSCGELNTGPIATGCTVCGAGRPGARLDAPPPPAPPAAAAAAAAQPRPFDFASDWAIHHADVSIEEAYRAGYEDGVRAVRDQVRKQQAAAAPAPGDKVTRTIIAALDYFADQVLQGHPEEVKAGEWCSAEEARAVIQQLLQQLQGVARA